MKTAFLIMAAILIASCTGTTTKTTTDSTVVKTVTVDTIKTPIDSTK